MKASPFNILDLGDDMISVSTTDETNITYTKTKLPDTFLKWQSSSRMNLFEKISKNGVKSIRYQPSHLPVVATYDTASSKINLSTKGIGVIPKKEILKDTTTSFQETLTLNAGNEWKETINNRMKPAQVFYSEPSNFDPYLLGGLEIFEGKTYENMMRNPQVTILYTGVAPDYHSYQITCIPEIIRENNPYYDFLLSARNLFAYDMFHIKQTKYPAGYLIHVIEVKNKTPYSRK